MQLSSKSTLYFQVVVTQILQEILGFACGLTRPSLFFAEKWNARITDLRKQVEELFEIKYGMCYAPFQTITSSALHCKSQPFGTCLMVGSGSHQY